MNSPSPAREIAALSAREVDVDQRELVVAPIWAVPMDIAPKYSGSASGMMNFGFGLASIISPFVFGYLIDRTGSWTLPFAVLSRCRAVIDRIWV